MRPVHRRTPKDVCEVHAGRSSACYLPCVVCCMSCVCRAPNFQSGIAASLYSLVVGPNQPFLFELGPVSHVLYGSAARCRDTCMSHAARRTGMLRAARRMPYAVRSRRMYTVACRIARSNTMLMPSPGSHANVKSSATFDLAPHCCSSGPNAYTYRACNMQHAACNT